MFPPIPFIRFLPTITAIGDTAFMKSILVSVRHRIPLLNEYTVKSELEYCPTSYFTPRPQTLADSLIVRTEVYILPMGQQFQIIKPIVALVLVLMVDLIPIRNGADKGFIYQTMYKRMF